MKYSFQPNLWMTVATLLVMGVCIKAGLWQYNKAEVKKALQTQLNARLNEPPVSLNDGIEDDGNLELLRFKRVKFSGVYETRYQVLIDNQVDNTIAGYHVITPLKLQGAKKYVLVNRGWIAGSPNRKLPEFDTPKGMQAIEGDLALPTAKFFTLEDVKEDIESKESKQQSRFKPVWQNLDMQLYAKSVPFAIHPFVVRLDNKSQSGGGFKRKWSLPAERVSMHLGYAYQWFGFALTMLVIYIVLNIKKMER